MEDLIFKSDYTTPIISVFNKASRKVKEYFINLIEYKKHLNTNAIKIWGIDNRLPIHIMDMIKFLPLVQQAIELKCSLMKGKRIYTYEISTENGKIKELSKIDNIANTLFEGSKLHQYLDNASFDYEYTANAFALIQLNANRTVAKIIHIPAHLCRYETQNVETGQFEYIWVSNYFTEGWKPTSKEIDEDLLNRRIVQKFRILDPIYPFQTIEKYKSDFWFIYHIKNYTPGNTVYGDNALIAAYNSGWMDISKGIPGLKKQSILNSMNVKYHIEYDIDYLRNDYGGSDTTTGIDTPKSKGAGDKAISAKKQAMQQSIDNSLSGVDGYDKAIYSPLKYFGSDKEPRHALSIKAIENKIDGKLIEDAMVSEYMLIQSTGVHPVLLGGGLPGTTSGGGQSGSSQRVAMDVLQVATEKTFHKLMEPFKIAYLINGGDVNVQFGREDIKLSSLDINPEGKTSITQ